MLDLLLRLVVWDIFFLVVEFVMIVLRILWRVLLIILRRRFIVGRGVGVVRRCKELVILDFNFLIVFCWRRIDCLMVGGWELIDRWVIFKLMFIMFLVLLFVGFFCWVWLVKWLW